MLTSKVAHASVVTDLLTPADAADTAAATSTAWTAVTDYEGYLVFVQQVGVVTAGGITGVIQHATDDSGTGAATAVSFTAVTTSNDPLTQIKFVECNAIGPYVRYVGTVATGPAVVGVSMVGVLKTTG